MSQIDQEAISDVNALAQKLLTQCDGVRADYFVIACIQACTKVLVMNAGISPAAAGEELKKTIDEMVEAEREFQGV